MLQRILFTVILTLAVWLTGCANNQEPLPVSTALPATPAAVSEPVITPTATLPSLATPEPLPDFLWEVRPEPASILSLATFEEVIEPEVVHVYESEGPPAPSVEWVGYRSNICLFIDPEPLLEPGVSFVRDEEISPHLQLTVDGIEQNTRAATDYMAFVDLGLECTCYEACQGETANWQWYRTPLPDNVACWFDPGFWVCYDVELGVGVHNVEFTFTGAVATASDRTYEWTFALVR